MKVENKYCDECKNYYTHWGFLCLNCRERENREKLAIWSAKTDKEKLDYLFEQIENLKKSVVYKEETY